MRFASQENLEEPMKHLVYTVGIAGLIGSLGTVTLAQSDTDAATLTCADFTAMSADEQRTALDDLKLAQAEGETTSTTGTDMSTDAGTTDATDMEATDTETDLSAEAEAEADTDMSADEGTDPEVEAVLAACEGNDEALVADHLPES